MATQDDPTCINTDRLILIVVGAHLMAEKADRPLAEQLRDRLRAWLDSNPCDEPCEMLVCTDLWYLNADELRTRPTISVGSPGVNALTAYLGDKIPSAFAIDGVLTVQLDPDFTDLVACCWGRDPTATAAAIDAFTERYQNQFMHKATLRLGTP